MACRKALNRTGALEERCGVGARIYLVSAEEDTDSVSEKQNLSGVTMTQVNVKALFTDYMDPRMSFSFSRSYCLFIGLDKGAISSFSFTVQTMLHYYI